MVTPCVGTAPLAVVDDVCVKWVGGELVEEADFLWDLSTIKVTILYSVTINYTRMYVCIQELHFITQGQCHSQPSIISSTLVLSSTECKLALGMEP